MLIVGKEGLPIYKYSMNRFYTILFLMMSFVCAFGHDKESVQELYEYGSYSSSDGLTINYRIISPDSTNIVESEESSYPLIVFMHGIGERGNDNKKQLEHGGDLFSNSSSRQSYPAYVIFPQCPDDYFWSLNKSPKSQKDIMKNQDETPIMKGVIELVENCANTLHIDKNRIYIVGLSMGGLAVYDAAWRHPDIFAAAVAICGAVNPDKLSSITDTSFRIYHGTNDDVIPIEASEAAYNVLKKHDIDAQLIELPDVGHECWDKAFASPDFLSWIFSKSKLHHGIEIQNAIASQP